MLEFGMLEEIENVEEEEVVEEAAVDAVKKLEIDEERDMSCFWQKTTWDFEHLMMDYLWKLDWRFYVGWLVSCQKLLLLHDVKIWEMEM